MRFRHVVTFATLALSISPIAFARQPTHDRAPERTAPSTAPDEKEFEVDDPMLKPVPPPPHVLASWKEALTLISSRDADLKTALAEVEKAKGLRRQALAGALPQINATGALTVELIRNNLPGTREKDPPSPVAEAALTLTQPILAPRAWYAIGTADRAIDLSKISASEARRELVSNVADAIVSVVTAERVAEINRADLEETLRRLGLEKRSVALGVGAPIDVVRFEGDATTARQTLVDGDEQLRLARERLGLALGSTEAFGVPSSIKLDDIEASAEKTCKRGKLRDRADIRALYQSKVLARREVTDADLAYAPTADLSSTLSTSSEAIAGTGTRPGM